VHIPIPNIAKMCSVVSDIKHANRNDLLYVNFFGIMLLIVLFT